MKKLAFLLLALAFTLPLRAQTAPSSPTDITDDTTPLKLATDRGQLKLVPEPKELCTSIVPPSRCRVAATTSRPTPRPEISVTASAVEKPG